MSGMGARTRRSRLAQVLRRGCGWRRTLATGLADAVPCTRDAGLSRRPGGLRFCDARPGKRRGHAGGQRSATRALAALVAQGAAIAAFALSEPDAGSDVGAMQMRALREQQGWKLDGCKTWISNGGIADFYCVFARTGEGSGAHGISAFIVPADTAGLTISQRIELIAPHPLARLEFRIADFRQTRCSARRAPASSSRCEPWISFGLQSPPLRSVLRAAPLTRRCSARVHGGCLEGLWATFN